MEMTGGLHAISFFEFYSSSSTTVGFYPLTQCVFPIRSGVQGGQITASPARHMALQLAAEQVHQEAVVADAVVGPPAAGPLPVGLPGDVLQLLVRHFAGDPVQLLGGQPPRNVLERGALSS